MAGVKEEKTKVRSIRFPTELLHDIDTHVGRIGKSVNRYLQELAENDLAQTAYKKLRKR
jgi:hypothetical protein